MKAIILVAIFAVAVYSQGWTNGVWNGTSNCATNCSYCNSFGTGVASVCTQPVAGQTFSAAPAACAACPSNCAQCNGTTCVTCNVGYVAISGACVVCSGTGAFSCASTAAGTTACLPSGPYVFSSATCNTGTSVYAYGAAGTQASGHAFVATSGAGACTQSDGNNMGLCVAYTACATTGYGVVSATGACSTATVSAATGQLYFTTTPTILACAVGYYPSQIGSSAVTTCTINPTTALTTAVANAATTNGYIPWCQVYNIGSTSTITNVICVACQSGFTINAASSPASSTAGQFCVPCSTISAACPQVGTWAGYYFNTSTSLWAACPTNVATCMYSASGVVATSCATGYYLQQQLGGVLACVATTTAPTDTHGLTYLNTSFALSCASGYYSAGPTIAMCQGCATCIGSVSNCTSCASGSTLSATYTCSNGTNSNTSKGSSVIFSGLAFFSAILYYFL